ncbi:MAG: pyridoxamine 5'-phosphate oxidase family protein, partial [Proteobacteria bacterium]|nr:pyridoxamine 5'-phosphate oxidase family protein [Pseudomonadota bacterium]
KKYHQERTLAQTLFIPPGTYNYGIIISPAGFIMANKIKMMSTTFTVDKIKALVRAKGICVLSTASDDAVPHCSLMAYVANNACTEIYMVTHRATRKYKNLLGNPVISLLIDSRENYPREQVQAITVSGIYQAIGNRRKREEVGARLLQQHPHLKDFILNPDAVIICIKVDSFLLLNGLTESYFISLSKV